jgi:hypothetical protein
MKYWIQNYSEFFLLLIITSVLRALFSTSIAKSNTGMVLNLLLPSILVIITWSMVSMVIFKRIKRSKQKHKWGFLISITGIISALISVYSVYVLHISPGYTLLFLPFFMMPLLFMLSLDL